MFGVKFKQKVMAIQQAMRNPIVIRAVSNVAVRSVRNTPSRRNRKERSVTETLAKSKAKEHKRKEEKRNFLRRMLDTLTQTFGKVQDLSSYIVRHIPYVWIGIISLIRGGEEILGKIFTFDFNIENVTMATDASLRGREVITTALGRDTVVTSKYGKRDLNGHSFHHGVDLRANVGDNVYSVFDGTVVAVNDTVNGKGGRYVLIKSDDKQTEYFVCHLSALFVKKGDKVKKGDLIALSGASGNGNENGYAPHLHLELRRLNENGRYVSYNPLGEPSVKSVGGVEIKRKSAKSDKITVRTNKDEDMLYGTLYLMRVLNLTAVQACGILGNLLTESQLRPYAWNRSGGGKGAQGIAQWRGVRIDKYKDKYGCEPKNDGCMEHQFEYVAYEFKKASYLTSLQQCKTIETATDVVMTKYERPRGRASYNDRVRNAKYAYDLYCTNCVGGTLTVNTLRMTTFVTDTIR